MLAGSFAHVAATVSGKAGQSRMVSSQLPEAMRVPSGLKATTPMGAPVSTILTRLVASRNRASARLVGTAPRLSPSVPNFPE